MVQPGNGLDLEQETILSQRGCDLGLEYLHSHFAVMLEVLREVDSGQPAPSDLTLDPVAVGESLLHAVE